MHYVKSSLFAQKKPQKVKNYRSHNFPPYLYLIAERKGFTPNPSEFEYLLHHLLDGKP